MLWLLLLLAETPQEHAARLRAQIEASIAAQRAVTRQQSEAARAAAPRPAPLPLSAAAAWTPPRSIMLREPPPCNPLSASDLAGLISSASKTENLNPFLIKEVARQESGFYPCAVSSQGAQGVMQLMPMTQIELGVSDPWDARQSIEAGSHLLRQLLDRYRGDVSLALGAYNAGISRVDQAGGIPAIPETQNYVGSILSRLLGTGAGVWNFAGGLGDGP